MFFRKRKVGPEYYLERGEECLRNGNNEWAAESFTNAIEFDPGLEMAYHGRAEAYMKLGRRREAVWDCIKFLETDRRQPDMAEDLDDVLRESMKMARRGWEKDRVRDEIVSYGIPDLIDELIEGYDPRGEYPDHRFYQLASSWLVENLKEDSLRIGFIHLLRGRYDEAIEEFDRGIVAGSGTPEAYYFRGVALLGKKKKAEGKRGVFNRGESAEELSGRAREDFKQALKGGYGWRLCPGCGYRASSETSFCANCGSKLLS